MNGSWLSRSIADDLRRNIVICLVHNLSSLTRQGADLATDTILKAMICRQLARIDDSAIDLSYESAGIQHDERQNTYSNNSPLEILYQEWMHMLGLHALQHTCLHIIK